MRQKFGAFTDYYYAGFEAQPLNVHVDFPLFQRIALFRQDGKTKIAGIKMHDTCLIRLMEVLPHRRTQLKGRRSADIHQGHPDHLRPERCRLYVSKLCYDLRKMKALGCSNASVAATCTDSPIKGLKPLSCSSSLQAGSWAVCQLAIPPLALEFLKPGSKIEAACHKADDAGGRLSPPWIPHVRSHEHGLTAGVRG